jgi:hypothetical protein
MVCSVCHGSEHNKRTCIVRKIQDDSDVADELQDQIIDYITERLTDEALITAIELGSDVVNPGLEFGIRFGRQAWRVLKGR